MQKLHVTSNIKTIQDALNVLYRLEAIDNQHGTSQPRSNQKTRQTRNNHHREDHRDGRTQAVAQTYIEQELRSLSNCGYSAEQRYNRQNTYRRSAGGIRNYSPGRNVTNVSAFNPEEFTGNGNRKQDGKLKGNRVEGHMLFAHEEYGAWGSVVVKALRY